MNLKPTKPTLIWLTFGAILVAGLIASSNLLLVASLWLASAIFLVLRFKSAARSLESLYYFGALMLFNIGIYAWIYRNLGIVPSNGAQIESGDYLYFSIVTWTTLGYGDIQPSSEAKLYAASQALYGYVYMGLLVGSVLHWLTGAETNNHSEKGKGGQKSVSSATDTAVPG